MPTPDTKVNFRTLDLDTIVRKLDPEHDKPDTAYEFKDGKRKFESTDRNGKGLYQTPT